MHVDINPAPIGANCPVRAGRIRDGALRMTGLEAVTATGLGLGIV